MPDKPDLAKWCQSELSQWENEGGAVPSSSLASSSADDKQADVPPLTNAELVQLRIRVIALENVLIALLTQASSQQLELVSDMADYICPRPGFTPHPLTIHASAQMIHLVRRASSLHGALPLPEP